MTSQKIGQRINSALASNNMKQKDLAKILGVTDNTISYYCSGTRTPKVDQLALIAQAMNVTTDYLLGLTDDPNPVPSVIDELGLSPLVVSKVINLKEISTDDCNMISKFNRVLEKDDIWKLIFLIDDYINATNVENIYGNLIEEYNGDTDAISRALLDMASKHQKTDIDLYDFFIAKAKSLTSETLARTGLDERSLSELIYLRIDRQLHETLIAIDEGKQNGND